MTSWSSKKPWNELALLPPAADLESKAVLKQCILSRAATAELKQAASLIPNAAMLLNTLPTLEAQASSEIENIFTTADALFQYAVSASEGNSATREALRYRGALLEGVRAIEARPIVTRTAEQICSRIKGTEMTVRKVTGTVIARGDTGEVVYTPPEGEALLRSLLANWERFLHNETSLDPLIRMAVAHYQFEAIHPFTDGNGRTGRILNSLFLVEQGLLSMPILYLSRYIIAHKPDYYRLLLSVTRDGAWDEWLLFVLRGVEHTAVWTTEKIVAIRDLLAHTADFMRRATPRVYSRELVDVIFEQPYCRIGNVVDAGIAARQAASRYLKALSSAGVLQEKVVGKEKLFVHPKLLSLLTSDQHAFARYASQPD